jgi:hypothetical protein
VALTDSLISHWALSEASGDAVDSHSTNTLTETSGTIASATGKVGNARDFEAGDTEYFAIASNASLQTGDIDWTGSVWVNAESLGANTVIAARDDILTSNREWILLFDNDGGGKFTFGVFNASTNVGSAIWGTAASTATWYHIIFWHDAGNNQIGITVNNGTPVVNATTGAPAVTTTALHVGSVLFSGSPNLYWDGLIDEFSFWKRVLTSDERTTLYNAGAGLAYPWTTGNRRRRTLICKAA